MLKKYNIAAELLVMAKAYYKEGNKKDAAKLAILAMEESDSQELIESLDNLNQELDPSAEAPVAEEEIISDAEIEEILKSVDDEAPEAGDLPAMEADADEPAAAEPCDEACEEAPLPPVEEVMAKVKEKKLALANLASLNGHADARKAAIEKFLK